MKWIDAFDATLARHGGKVPTDETTRHGDALIAGLIYQSDDGTHSGRWRVVAEVNLHTDGPDAPPPTWSVWDLRAFGVGEARDPDLVVSGLSSAKVAMRLADLLAGSRLLRMVHAATAGAARIVRDVRREWMAGT